jgi:hypothetical protein
MRVGDFDVSGSNASIRDDLAAIKSMMCDTPAAAAAAACTGAAAAAALL